MKQHLVIGEFADEAPYTCDYTFMNIYYRSIRERLKDYLTKLDYMVGHRLVLVLERVLRAASDRPATRRQAPAQF